jgi:hypothetical protein
MFSKGSYDPSMDRLPCESADDREPLLWLEPSVLLEKPQVWLESDAAIDYVSVWI